MTPDPADRGLLAVLLELLEDTEAPATSAAIARAVGVPEEYADIVEQRLERNRERGYVRRDEDGRWHPTPTGIAVAASGPVPGRMDDGRADGSALVR